MTEHRLFIAGTDTDVGKTLIAQGLLVAARREGKKTVALKPIAAGCEEREGAFYNDDALKLQAAMTESRPYQEVNPVALAPAIAPHIAAEEEGVSLTANAIVGHCNRVSLQDADWLLVEGAGGWRVPLNDQETMADIAIAMKLDVILVVAMRLGCINHALLTAEAIQRDGLNLVGWVANQVAGEMPRLTENLETLEQRMPAPLLGAVPTLNAAPSQEGDLAEQVADHLDISNLQSR